MNNDELIGSAQAFADGRQVSPRHLRGGRRERFFAAAEAVFQLPEKEWPQFVPAPRLRTTERELKAFRAYKERRDKVAAELNLDPALIASKSALEALAREDGSTLASLLPWQRDLLQLPEPQAEVRPSAR